MKMTSSFLSDAKRFLAPLKDFRAETMRNIFDQLWALSFTYANILIVTQIMKSIEQ